MNANKKRGQAALEFLTTYGWAFLVILIMIGALAYFGVLNPKGLLPSRCTFSPEVDCQEANIIGNGADLGGTVAFRFRNNVGSTAEFNVSMVYLGGDNPEASGCVPIDSAGVEIVDGLVDVAPGRLREVICTFDAAPDVTLPADDKAKFEVTVNIKKSGGSYWNPIKGEIYGTVN